MSPDNNIIRVSQLDIFGYEIFEPGDRRLGVATYMNAVRAFLYIKRFKEIGILPNAGYHRAFWDRNISTAITTDDLGFMIQLSMAKKDESNNDQVLHLLRYPDADGNRVAEFVANIELKYKPAGNFQHLQQVTHVGAVENSIRNAEADNYMLVQLTMNRGPGAEELTDNSSPVVLNRLLLYPVIPTWWRTIEPICTLDLNRLQAKEPVIEASQMLEDLASWRYSSKI